MNMASIDAIQAVIINNSDNNIYYIIKWYNLLLLNVYFVSLKFDRF